MQVYGGRPSLTFRFYLVIFILFVGWNPPDCPPGIIEMYHVYVDGFLKTTVRATDKTRALVEGVDSTKVSLMLSVTYGSVSRSLFQPLSVSVLTSLCLSIPVSTSFFISFSIEFENFQIFFENEPLLIFNPYYIQ